MVRAEVVRVVEAAGARDGSVAGVGTDAEAEPEPELEPEPDHELRQMLRQWTTMDGRTGIQVTGWQALVWSLQWHGIITIF